MKPDPGSPTPTAAAAADRASLALRHAGYPLVPTLALLQLYGTPVEVFGCVGRGLLALGVTLAATLAALAATGLAIRARAHGRPATRWLVTTLVLVLPAVLLLAFG